MVWSAFGRAHGHREMACLPRLLRLLDKDGFAIFGSLSDAQAAGEIHLYDGYPNAVATNDDLLWSEQSVRPVELGVPQLKPTSITISGTVDGELDPITFPATLSHAEQLSICRLAQVAVLEKAVGMTVVSAFLALTQATNRTKVDLQQAADAIAVEMPRLIKLFKRCRENGLGFTSTAKAQRKIVLRGLSGCSDVADSVLDRALDLPLQLLTRWVSFDKKTSSELRPSSVQSPPPVCRYT
jgi:hypothetical protein